jgi:hypothetical protein
MIAAIVKAGTWGASTCGVEAPDGTKCGAPATTHALLDVGFEGQINLCTPCFRFVRRVGMTVIDHHDFGRHCNIPDAKWIRSTPDRPGTCHMPNDLTEDIERFANEPESVHA